MTIVFRMTAGMSHYNSALRLAVTLNGLHDVYFIGSHSNLINIYLHAHHLKYINFHEAFEAFGQPDGLTKRISWWLFGDLNSAFALFTHYRHAFDQLFDEIRPDIIFLDEQLRDEQVIYTRSSALIFLVNTQIRDAALFTYPAKYARTFAPATILDRISTVWDWMENQFRRIRNKTKILLAGILCSQPAFIFAYIRFLASRRPTELFMLPEAFEFRKATNPRYQYMGYQIIEDRPDFDFTTGQCNDIMQSILKSAKDRKIIYLSFGTIPVTHYPHYRDIIFQFVEWFSRHPEFVLLISDLDFFKVYGQRKIENVKVYERLPQLDVLKDTFFMINHGGLNTILECAYLEVPSLIIPLNNRGDQWGNAKRVEFHGLGKSMNLVNSSQDFIDNVIEHMVKKHHEYVMAIKKFNESARTDSTLDAFIKGNNL